MSPLKYLLGGVGNAGRRSSALGPVNWLLVLLIGGALANQSLKGQEWLSIALSSLAGITVFYFLGIHLYFARSNPDYLCSEQFVLRKMEIEHRLLGDNRVGLQEPRNVQIPPEQIERIDYDVDDSAREERGQQ